MPKKETFTSRFEETRGGRVPQKSKISGDVVYGWSLRHDSLLRATTSEIELARIKAVSAKHASDWLKAYPVTSLGLKLNNSSFRIACALRIGAPFAFHTPVYAIWPTCCSIP